jgi:hypothetical protein
MNSPFFTALIRHLLTASGGWLIQRGYTDASGVEQVVGGLTVMVGVVLSWLHKHGVEQRVLDLRRRFIAGGEAASLNDSQIGQIARSLERLPTVPPAGPNIPLVILGGLMFLLLLAGCAGQSTGSGGSTSTLTPQRVQAIAKLAAYAGTRADLQSHPEHRPAFVAAQRQLQVLVDQERWDIAAMATALQGAPIEQLQSSEGTLYLTGGIMLLDAIGAGQWDARSNENVRAVILGTNEGIRLALGIEVTATTAAAGTREYRAAVDNAEQGILETLTSEAEATRPLFIR